MRFSRLVLAVAALGLVCAGAGAAAAPRETPADNAVTRAWEFTDLDGVARTIDWRERPAPAACSCSSSTCGRRTACSA